MVECTDRAPAAGTVKSRPTSPSCTRWLPAHSKHSVEVLPHQPATAHAQEAHHPDEHGALEDRARVRTRPSGRGRKARSRSVSTNGRRAARAYAQSFLRFTHSQTQSSA